MSFADIFVTEEFTDEVAENSEIQTQPPQVQVVLGETDEFKKLLNDNSDSVKESENSSEMTLKQGEPETDQFAVDGLLVNPDDLLPPVVKLEKYAESDIAFNRQVVVRNLLETLRVVHGNSDNVSRVINVMCGLSEDYDPIVRSELMGQFPYIAAFCKEVGLCLQAQNFLWPILINYLRTENSQVRKASHTALLTIVEQRQIDSEMLTEKICPLVVHLTDGKHPEDLRTDIILLISKLAVLLGKKITEDLFVPCILELCTDKANYVRKACASAIGEICTTLGRETTEELLLPKFIGLCKDTTWAVRKACAENFMPVSCVVSRDTRCRELSENYMILLKDESRWVRVTAYQGLGPFISTFAEPEKTGLYYSKDGILTVVDFPQSQESSPLSKSENACDVQCNNNCENSEVSQTTENSDGEEFWTSAPKSCDSKVPLSCCEKSLSASEIPGIPCHVGNYCTVIEVSCPSKTVTAAKDGNDAINNTPTENGSHSFSEEKSSDAQSDSASTLDTCNSKSVVNRNVWYEFLYGTEDSTIIVNGDVSNNDLKEDSPDCEKIQKIVTSQVESTLLNSVTVNGIHLHPSEVLSESLNCHTIPVVNCMNTNKQIMIENGDIMKTVDTTSTLYTSEVTAEEDSNLVSSNVHVSGAIVDSTSDTSVVSDDQYACINESVADESAFNHFQYWRTPIPEIDVDSVCSDFCSSNETSNSKFQTSMLDQNCQSLSNGENLVHNHELLGMNETFNTSTNQVSSENKEGEPPPGENTISVHDQDIVPPELLLCYLNMIDAAWAEIAHHCAYSLPAVALTLGRKFWPCLKETFDALSSDLKGFIMMWKVRRTVASSMHQLAVILGPEITSRDLLPVFSRFINDLDEVRIGILQHIAEFLKVLHPEERKVFLPSLSEFLVSNSDSESNEKNWRFRLILAEQLVSVADLYEPEDVIGHLMPLSLTLIQDKICEVRRAAVRIIAAVIRRINQFSTQELTKKVLGDLAEKLIHSPKWLYRQLYVYICQEFVVANSLSPDQVAEFALPQLLYLCWDRVPNVRIAIARCLAGVMWPLEPYSCPDSPHRELLLQTIHTLQSDLDVDVQFYANMVSTDECSCLQHGEYTNLGELPV